jgi:hypothetical protein
MLLDRLLDRTSNSALFQMNLRWCTVVLLAILLVAAPVGAHGRDWVVTEMAGTVLQLDDSGWREVDRSSVFGGDVAFRTLQRGRLRLQSDDAELRIGPNSVAEVLSGQSFEETLVRHYDGTLLVSVGSSGGELRIEALDFVIVPQAGTTTVRIAGETADVQIADGGLAVVTEMAGGRGLSVTARVALQGGKLPDQAASGASGGPGFATGGTTGQGGNPGNGNAAGEGPSSGGPPRGSNPGNAGGGPGNAGAGPSNAGGGTGNAGGGPGDASSGGGPPPGAGNPGHGNQGSKIHGTGGPGSGTPGTGGVGSQNANATAGEDDGFDG